MNNLFIEGLALNASLILGLGAQNIFVLNAGLHKQSPLLVATVCSLCDLILIFIGVWGAASFFIQFPLLKVVVGILGVFFLLFYAIQKIREGLKTGVIEELKDNQQSMSRKKAILLALSFSILNPHVYLDTVILIGGFAAKYTSMQNRLWFGFGAASFSTLWFFSIASLAFLFSRFLTTPRALRIINLSAGIVLSLLCLKLGKEVYLWIQQITFQ